MHYTELNYVVQDAVATIELNRPEQLNALTFTLEAELYQAIADADADPGVRTILVTGAGRAFCAGMDISQLEGLPPEDIRSRRHMRTFDMNRRADYQTRYSYFPSCSKPIISAVNGAAAGLGFVLALYSDFRLASRSAVFTTAFAKRGLVAEHGVAWILPRIVGAAHATDLLMTSRRVEAEEALRIGLVHQLSDAADFRASAHAFAMRLGRDVSPRSLRVMKRQLWEAPFQSLAEAVCLANDEMVRSLGSEDFREGVAHFVERRAPAFTGQ